jgi:hypothetical protein
MMNTSTVSRPTSSATLLIHTQVGTFTRGYLRRRWIAPEVSSARMRAGSTGSDWVRP